MDTNKIDEEIIDKVILISKERLNVLELLEKNLPEIIEKAIVNDKKAKLKLLHDKDKQNPAGVNARVKRYNEKNKDKINERRLLKRNKGIVYPILNFAEVTVEKDDKFTVNLE